MAKEVSLNEETNDISVKVISSVIRIWTDHISSPIVKYEGKFDIDKFGTRAVISENTKSNNSISINGRIYSNGRGTTIISSGGNIIISGNGVTVNGVSINGGTVNNSEQTKLDIIVPKTTENLKLDISSTSGDVSIKDLTLLKLIINSISGDITLDRINSIYSQIKTTSGDVKARLLESMLNYELKMKSVSGDIDSRTKETEAPTILSNKNIFDVKSLSGDIDVVFEGQKHYHL